MCRQRMLYVSDLVKHQSTHATCVLYTGETVGHYLGSGADEVRNDVIWRRAGVFGIKEWSVRVQ